MEEQLIHFNDIPVIKEICVSFCPCYQRKEWDLTWIRQIVFYLPISYILVNQYIILEQIPTLTFISGKYKDSFIGENSLPLWTKAVCTGERIFILFESKRLNWKRIIDHELFHVAVFYINPDPRAIPGWFNEALAYLIGQNTDFNRKKLSDYIKTNTDQIRELILKNILINRENQFSTELIKSLGQFLGLNFSKRLIKSFFCSMRERQDFQNVFYERFGISLINFIDNWIKFVILN
jgi:hypothetical protein